MAADLGEDSPPEAEKLITSWFPAEILFLSGLIQTNPPQWTAGFAASLIYLCLIYKKTNKRLHLCFCENYEWQRSWSKWTKDAFFLKFPSRCTWMNLWEAFSEFRVSLFTVSDSTEPFAVEASVWWSCSGCVDSSCQRKSRFSPFFIFKFKVTLTHQCSWNLENPPFFLFCLPCIDAKWDHTSRRWVCIHSDWLSQQQLDAFLCSFIRIKLFSFNVFIHNLYFKMSYSWIRWKEKILTWCYIGESDIFWEEVELSEEFLPKTLPH